MVVVEPAGWLARACRCFFEDSVSLLTWSERSHFADPNSRVSVKKRSVCLFAVNACVGHWTTEGKDGTACRLVTMGTKRRRL